MGERRDGSWYQELIWYDEIDMLRCTYSLYNKCQDMAASAADGGGDVHYMTYMEEKISTSYLLNLSEARAIRSHMINANFES